MGSQAGVASGAHIVLGVTGSIAAYKAIELARLCVKGGATVDVLMTPAATRFVTPLTFATLTQRRVWTTPYEPWSESEEGHISVGQQADVFVIAPATAGTLARLAHGFADDMVSLTALATPAPVIVAPAMNFQMWAHPAVRANVATLRSRGVHIVGPDEGPLASGMSGQGRLVEMERLFGEMLPFLRRRGDLLERRVVVTAGGTQEPIDPVRYIGNRSSGTMGYALAARAVARGASVTLISGPTALTPPAGARVISVGTAAEMETATHHAVSEADALIMSAAVADFRPVAIASQKIKKTTDASVPMISLERTPDILAGLRDAPLVKIGFAAETEDLIANARGKLLAKGLSMIVANDAVATIGAANSAATFLFPDDRVIPLPTLAKEVLADRILDELVRFLHAATADPSLPPNS